MNRPSVAFITFCHPPHLPKLHKENVLRDILVSHAYPFNEIIVVHQRCQGIPYRPITEVDARVVESEGYYPGIFAEYGIQWPDPVADEWTHGPEAAHYWAWHCLNHLIGAKVARSDYIVFSDCDCKIVASDERRSWVTEGIAILERQRDVFCVTPNDGSPARRTQMMSQQLFLVNRERFMRGPLGISWDGKFIPGGPFQEWYFMLEGRIGRLLAAKNWWRYILSSTWRYWHSNPWEP